MGYEFVGYIVVFGLVVMFFKIGDKVVFFFIIFCMNCFYCNLGCFFCCVYFLLFGFEKLDGV